MEIREYLVLKYDGTSKRFPVLEGDVAQARVRAALCHRPGDCVVAVTEGAYIRVRSDSLVENPDTWGSASTRGAELGTRSLLVTRLGTEAMS